MTQLIIESVQIQANQMMCHIESNNKNKSQMITKKQSSVQVAMTAMNKTLEHWIN